MKKVSKQQLVNIIREALSDDTLKLPGFYRKQTTPTQVNPELRKTFKELPSIGDREPGETYAEPGYGKEIGGELEALGDLPDDSPVKSDIEDQIKYFMDTLGYSRETAEELYAKRQKDIPQKQFKPFPKSTLSEMVRQEIKNFLKNKA